MYEVCKVILGFALIMQLKLGLLGAIYSMISSYVIQILFYITPTAKEILESVKWTYLRGWLKASPINLYNIVGNNIARAFESHLLTTIKISFSISTFHF